jgi:hypothetical protein
MGRPNYTNRHDNGDSLGPMPQSAHFQNEAQTAAELIERAESLPLESTSRRLIEQRLETEFNMVRKT